jgi:hypothetical protein
VAKRLRDHVDHVRLKGDGTGKFIVADLGDRGVELYGGHEGEWYIDPAVGDRLQGELAFEDIDQALAVALRWLREGK